MKNCAEIKNYETISPFFSERISKILNNVWFYGKQKNNENKIFKNIKYNGNIKQKIKKTFVACVSWNF